MAPGAARSPVSRTGVTGARLQEAIACPEAAGGAGAVPGGGQEGVLPCVDGEAPVEGVELRVAAWRSSCTRRRPPSSRAPSRTWGGSTQSNPGSSSAALLAALRPVLHRVGGAPGDRVELEWVLPVRGSFQRSDCAPRVLVHATPSAPRASRRPGLVTSGARPGAVAGGVADGVEDSRRARLRTRRRGPRRLRFLAGRLIALGGVGVQHHATTGRRRPARPRGEDQRLRPAPVPSGADGGRPARGPVVGPHPRLVLRVPRGVRTAPAPRGSAAGPLGSGRPPPEGTGSRAGGRAVRPRARLRARCRRRRARTAAPGSAARCRPSGRSCPRAVPWPLPAAVARGRQGPGAVRGAGQALRGLVGRQALAGSFTSRPMSTGASGPACVAAAPPRR